MICITGIPGSGKSTLCEKLRESGIKCVSVLEISGFESCRSGDEVDIDCLSEKLNQERKTDLVIEGHFSHLLGCESVIILDRNEKEVVQELLKRGYPDKKIKENIDALRSDIIYHETLDLLPSTRIIRIEVEEGRQDKVLDQAMGLLKKQKNKS